MKITVITNGCPENRIDGARMREFLSENGYQIFDDYRQADIILFNACGLTEDLQNLSIKIFHKLEATKKASAEIVVYGCLSKINPERLRSIYKGHTFGSDDIQQVTSILEVATDADQTHANYLIPQTLINTTRLDPRNVFSPILIPKLIRKCRDPWKQPGATIMTPNTYYIKISTGCLNACSYCGVRLSRGKLRSKSAEQIISEFEAGLKQGYQEFALIGTDLGAYGRDRGTRLTALLRELIKYDGQYKIKLRNIQPRFLIEMMSDFIEILPSGKIAYIGSAAESGNNRILRQMNRGYKIEAYKNAVLSLKRIAPLLQINTQIMIGFPGETDADFDDTIRLLDEVPFDFVEVYIFQARPNTQAEKLGNPVPPQVAKRRFCKLYMKALFKEYKILW
ncbi:radical SAM protein [candidate division KSB1 bacterium]|nr:radical SAM protein [candidate division KSB1 bacterium]